jgi:hypothetical protein
MGVLVRAAKVVKVGPLNNQRPVHAALAQHLLEALDPFFGLFLHHCALVHAKSSMRPTRNKNRSIHGFAAKRKITLGSRNAMRKDQT